ncbi:hypothetical protein [Weissella confusa]|nr:hypothetical protein [Weissella confusa]
MTAQTHHAAGPIEVGFSIYANPDGTLRGYVEVLTPTLIDND